MRHATPPNTPTLLQDTVVICPSQLSQRVALAALETGQEYIASQIAGLDGAQCYGVSAQSVNTDRRCCLLAPSSPCARVARSTASAGSHHTALPGNPSPPLPCTRPR